MFYNASGQIVCVSFLIKQLRTFQRLSHKDKALTNKDKDKDKD